MASSSATQEVSVVVTAPTGGEHQAVAATGKTIGPTQSMLQHQAVTTAAPSLPATTFPVATGTIRASDSQLPLPPSLGIVKRRKPRPMKHHDSQWASAKALAKEIAARAAQAKAAEPYPF